VPADEVSREPWSEGRVLVAGLLEALSLTNIWPCIVTHIGQCNDEHYSLATAAAACGVSKSVILRAIIAGKISGSKDKHVEPAP